MNIIINIKFGIIEGIQCYGIYSNIDLPLSILMRHV
jgi:hypothetical protein